MSCFELVGKVSLLRFSEFHPKSGCFFCCSTNDIMQEMTGCSTHDFTDLGGFKVERANPH